MVLNLLSLEGTAWCFGASIFYNDQIISKDFKYNPKFALDSTDCYNHHLLKLSQIKQFILENISKFDCVSYSKGPGFLPCLKLTAFIAKYLKIYYKKECYGVNHGLAHIFHVLVLNKVRLDRFIALYVSGGNTILFKFENNVFEIIGETLDIAVGNLLDKFAITLNLDKPNGLAIQNLAKLSKTYTLYRIQLKGLHFNLSGLINKISASEDSNETKCNSLLHSIAICLSEICERSSYMYGINNLIVAGGVAQNLILQRTLGKMCKYNKLNFFCVEGKQNSDNSEMIGSFYKYNLQNLKAEELHEIKSNRFIKYSV